jgi:hypothetical protein
MAKRFTDTEKWKKPFIRSMPGAYKLLWIYICDDCDHAGVWQVDIEVAQIRLGETITEKLAIEIFGDKIKVFDGGSKWFIPSFIEFQYPSGLSENNKAHAGVIKILEKYKLLEKEIKPLTSPLQGDKEMVMDKEMDKDEEMDKEEPYKNFIIPQMTNFWYQSFPLYTKDLKNDSHGMGVILNFMTKQAGVLDITDESFQSKILNTLQLIADQVQKESFWINKPIKSIANNIQEFYNKIKNPLPNGKQHNKNGQSLREQVQTEFTKRYGVGQ